MPHSNEKIIPLLLLMLVTFGQIAIDIYLPSLPAMANQFQVSSEIMQHTLSAYFIGMVSSLFFFGVLSDRYGRRKILLFAMSIFLIATLFCINAHHAGTLIAARLFQGIGIGSSFALARAIARDLFSGEKLAKIIASLSMVWSGVLIIAPVMGSYFQRYFDWRMNFIFLFVYVGAGYILIWRYLPETHLLRDENSLKFKSLLQNYIELFTHKIFLAGSVCVFILNAIFFAYSAAAPFLLQNQLHIPVLAYGWLTFGLAVIYFLGSSANNYLTNRVPYKKTFTVVFITYFLAGLSMFIFAAMGFMNIYVILIPVIFLFLCDAFIYPYCMLQTTLEIPSQAAGNASAVFSMIAQLGCFAGTSLIARMNNNHLALSLIMLAGSLLIMFVFYFFLLEQ